MGPLIHRAWKYIQQIFIELLLPYSKDCLGPGCREVKRQRRSLLTGSLYSSGRNRSQTNTYINKIMSDAYKFYEQNTINQCGWKSLAVVETTLNPVTKKFLINVVTHELRPR